MNENLKKILNHFEENSKKPTSESAIYLSLTKAEFTSGGLSEIDNAEYLAFSIAEPHVNNEPSSWPYYKFLNQTEAESLIKKDHVKHWIERLKETSHPTLKARYAGLVWQYSKPVLNETPDFKTAEAFVISVIDIIENKLYDNSIDAKNKMGIAFCTAVSLNNLSLIAQMKGCILRYEQAIPTTETKFHWGAAYDFLLEKNIKWLSAEEISTVVTLLDERLTELKSIDPWATEAAAIRLAKFYRLRSNAGELKRVLLSLEESYEPYIKKGPNIKAAGYLQKIHKIFSEFNLREESAKILVRQREAERASLSEYQTITAEITVPTRELNERIERILSGDVETVFMRLADGFVPDKEESAKGLTRSASGNHVRYILPRVITDDYGRTIAEIRPLREDFDTHLALHISESITYNSALLELIWKRAIEMGLLTKDNILGFIKKSAIIESERLQLISKALDAYFEGDNVVFIHLIIPQIEQSMRNLLEINRGSVYTFKNNGYPYKTFDTVLREPAVAENLGEDHATYFRLLFTEQKGINLRNEMAHGMMRPEKFTKSLSAIVLHSLLCLGMIRFYNNQR